MPEPHTSLQELLHSTAQRLAHRSDTPRLEAALLLGTALNATREQIAAGLVPPLTIGQQQTFESLLQRRMQGEPLAYLRGFQEFYGRPFLVNPSVLIPRPETELLVDAALCMLQPEQLCIDVCTGSGCIAVSLALHCSQAQIAAADISPTALSVARQNALLNQTAQRLCYIQGDLLSPLANSCCRVLVSNPPYIPADEIDALTHEISQYEPRLALNGGADGMRFYRQLARQGKRVLLPGGCMLLEAGAGQAPLIEALLAETGWRLLPTLPDLQGIPRVVRALRP